MTEEADALMHASVQTMMRTLDHTLTLIPNPDPNPSPNLNPNPNPNPKPHPNRNTLTRCSASPGMRRCDRSCCAATAS